MCDIKKNQEKTIKKIIFILFVCAACIVGSDKCYPLATLTEVSTFYRSQPFSQKVLINMEDYTKAFANLGGKVGKFDRILTNYSTNDKLNALEPVPLLPLTDESNVYIIEDDTLGKSAFKACAKNGGSLVRLDSSNRERLAKILKDEGISKIPVHVLPHFSFLSLTDFEPLATPENVDTMIESWQKTPPWLTSDNKLEYPASTIQIDGNTVSSLDSHFKSPVLCQKPNNPWDLPDARKDWLGSTSKIKTALALLKNLKRSYDQSVKSLRKVAPAVHDVANVFKLALPEPFKNVLSFLDRFSKPHAWDKVTKLDQFHNFAKQAIKLIRQFNLTPNSITRLPEDDVKISPISIDDLNWRQYFNLDNDHGVVGPFIIRPISYNESESGIANVIPTQYEAIISARVYNRIKDKVIIYSVTPNAFNGKITTIQTIIVTDRLNLALEQELRPLQCINADTEIYPVCHGLPLKPVVSLKMSSLTKCANALLSETFLPDFSECPKASIQIMPSVYSANCEPDDQPTVIINSDLPVQVEFKCDSEISDPKNITSFPTMIPTSCEVRIVDGTSSMLALPQWNPDFLQDPVVGDFIPVDLPKVEIPQRMVILLSVVISVSCMFTFTLVLLLFYCCCVKCCCKCNKCCKCCKKPDTSIEDDVPAESEHEYLPAIRMREIPFSN